MTETFGRESIKADIDLLEKMIEEKRAILEKENNIVEEKELVREAVKEVVKQTAPVLVATAPKTGAPAPAPSKSYLDDLSAEETDQVKVLVGVAFTKGLEASIKQSQSSPEYIQDAFHDVLTDRLYEEIIARKVIN
ncbi:MAG: hypothetical protein AAB682_00575 [Patescibacteria group bacterium]